MLEKAVKTAKKAGIKSSICGQAPTTYPNLAKSLVDWGINSISVSADTAYLTRKIVSEAEHDLVIKKRKKA